MTTLLVIVFAISIAIGFRLLFLLHHELLAANKSAILLREGLVLLKDLMIKEEKKVFGNSVAEEIFKKED